MYHWFQTYTLSSYFINSYYLSMISRNSSNRLFYRSLWYNTTSEYKQIACFEIELPTSTSTSTLLTWSTINLESPSLIWNPESPFDNILHLLETFLFSSKINLATEETYVFQVLTNVLITTFIFTILCVIYFNIVIIELFFRLIIQKIKDFTHVIFNIIFRRCRKKDPTPKFFIVC